MMACERAGLLSEDTPCRYSTKATSPLCECACSLPLASPTANKLFPPASRAAPLVLHPVSQIAFLHSFHLQLWPRALGCSTAHLVLIDIVFNLSAAVHESHRNQQVMLQHHAAHSLMTRSSVLHNDVLWRTLVFPTWERFAKAVFGKPGVLFGVVAQGECR